MIHELVLPSGNSVRLVTDQNGRDYAQVISGSLDDMPVSSPTSPSTIGNSIESHSVDWLYKCNDANIVTDASGLHYWGVTEKRPK